MRVGLGRGELLAFQRALTSRAASVPHGAERAPFWQSRLHQETGAGVLRGRPSVAGMILAARSASIGGGVPVLGHFQA